MTAVERLAADVIGPVPPDRERIAVEVFQVVPGRPQEQRRAADAAASGAVGLVVLAVEAQPGPAILHHGVHGVRVVDRAAVILVGLEPMDSAVAVYQASGSALMIRSAGRCVWPNPRGG